MSFEKTKGKLEIMNQVMNDLIYMGNNIEIDVEEILEVQDLEEIADVLMELKEANETILNAVAKFEVLIEELN